MEKRVGACEKFEHWGEIIQFDGRIFSPDSDGNWGFLLLIREVLGGHGFFGCCAGWVKMKLRFWCAVDVL